LETINNERGEKKRLLEVSSEELNKYTLTYRQLQEDLKVSGRGGDGLLAVVHPVSS
jgi:hypothetical protein